MNPALPVLTDETVTAIALAAARGDSDASERFVQALQLDVRRFVTYLAKDAQAADDLTQDTFLRALSSLHRFEGRSSARTWLLSIARRVVADSLRHAAVRPRVADTADWQLAAERSQPKGLPGFDEGLALTELIDALSQDRREAFVLTQLLGLSYAEVAALRGCPVGTVRSRVSRARRSLARCLTDAPSVPDGTSGSVAA
ncbi:sigma-70 family RNA polymerase sigma factor [Streptomyces nodosus]|uniref:RNA polymerase sigma factor n=1 Tax=Streptomyces nodosus TaxID=40318 RepID=A0A0B5DRW5_9ACTN|nr:sigma-70 family RNA polymerase sigma factor [Streptomyces nodosus]AJE44040.1 RNA polymerase sigma factor [Streptomyces nodosus]MBB4795619.1 RNA polymerase sigma-70 factor (ECF subfamily) [Streptomyces nodosus]QEV42531.1 sigma-70 family RNA polymerase sigma factor [Streptomyces nodosus]